ncbi:MAG: hypothetical protein IPN61_09070 [Bacteroidetes bacterium]|nr:hypothetical protein [Bacteroidota bacterium]
MKSLFEKEEKEKAINQLKIDLISRFYPFSHDNIIKYKDTLNFDRYYLMDNPVIKWDRKLLIETQDKIDWTALWKLKNLNLNLSLIENFEHLIDFKTIHLADNLCMSEEMLLKYGSKFNWSRSLVLKTPQILNNLRKYKDVVDWDIISRSLNIPFHNDLIVEFIDYWNWEKLSQNVNLPAEVEFIKSYEDKLNFDLLSMNPAFAPIIINHPNAYSWNWDLVSVNSGITYNKSTFDLIFSYFKKEYKYRPYSKYFNKSKHVIESFLEQVFSFQLNNINFFLNDQFIPYIPWDKLSKYCKVEFDADFIYEHLDKFDFKQKEFILKNKNSITSEFIENNLSLFDPNHYSFYKLPLRMQLIINNPACINWNYLSRCQTLNWTWEFVFDHLYDFNIFQLSVNKKIYDDLISPTLSNTILDDILSYN